MNDLISRQAAIDALSHMMDTDGFRDGWAVSRANVDCMLRALPSAEPELCEDAVSRNAIIQKLNMMDRYVSEELRLCDTDKKFPKNEVFIVDDVYEEIVENLPSAQPEPSEIARDIATIIENEKDMRVVLKNSKPYEAAKRLNDLIFDINPTEIYAQIEVDNLKQWCEIIQAQMKMAMVQLPCWAEKENR